MTTDPTDAALNAVISQGEDADVARPFVVAAIDAWLRAAVACPQCQETGTYTEAENGCPTDYVLCPGPHTQIKINCSHDAHFGTICIPEILYADPDIVRLSIRATTGTDKRLARWVLFLPLPPGWTAT